ncbi:TIGR03862 family flavoprotein [Maritimibacter sp. 55A14]|uniref:TIGR03862 family flavoprotein n=1 Tax=Maritimibacter sp. 55A14 TaxID=2174844 RepID=UPI001E46426C
MEKAQTLVIGGGPAGLMAAGALAGAGHAVTVAEARPSLGRKFLMAGKSGLNLTMDEPLAALLPRYAEAAEWLAPMLRDFGPDAIQDWARGLGQEVFTGSSGRVFPRAMKASPLLRAWLARLAGQGVTFRTRWRWTGWDGPAFAFDTPKGKARIAPAACVLALGGASWPRLGSDGAWAEMLAARGVMPAPFRPANMGLRVDWSAHMRTQFGQPVKGTALSAGGPARRGDYVISARGLEGGGIYAVSRAVRDGAALTIDLKPDWSSDRIASALARPRGKTSRANHLRKALGLPAPARALLMEFGRPLPEDPAALAALIKALPVNHAGPRPLGEAISTAGGVPRAALDSGLMLTGLRGTFCAGEMLDWEAPTGGYLLTACLATGLWAGRHAAAWASNQTSD